MREPSSFSRPSGFLLIPLMVMLVGGAVACGNGAPDVSSQDYRKTVSTFYVGLAALQVGDDVRAEAKLKEATTLAPDEPAAWANLGLLYLRQKEFEQASENLEKARALAPDNAQIQVLHGLLESNRGRFAESITHLRRAVELDPKNLKAVYMLAQEIERAGGEGGDAEAQRLFEKILETDADNLAVQLELTRIAAKRGDAETLRRTVARIAERASAWPPEAQEQLRALQEAAAGANPRQAASRVAFLRNVLVRVPDYRQSLLAVKDPPEVVGEPLARFVKLPSPNPQPAPPDEALAFVVEPLPEASGNKWAWVGTVLPNGAGAPVVLLSNGREARIGGTTMLPLRGGVAALPAPDSVAALDFDYDFKTDLVFVGSSGVQLMKQESPQAFTDVTARASLPASITSAPYASVWAADVESDGDLDIVLATDKDAPLVLRNNGDGTFKDVRPFAGVSSVRGFAWADLDADGDPDAAFADDAGQLAVFANERGGQFRQQSLPAGAVSEVVGTEAADVDNDGRLDFVALQADGAIKRLSNKTDGASWDIAEIARWPNAAGGLRGERASIFAADFDNNGGIDLLASSRLGNAGAQVWLGDGQGKFNPLAASPAGAARVFSVADLNGDGRLDFVGLSADGQPLRGVARGTKNYHWQRVRPRAQTATGDQRINSFGVGGEMEIRSGLLVQKQAITSPVVHFGLGENTGADVVRIVWPNGAVQAEFELKADGAVLAEQRLKGSCPWVFAWDGQRMNFVTDFIWRSPLGLRINAQDTAGVAMTEDWVKIRGDQLAAHQGFYDVSITAELWETHYFDHVSLLVVDHPAGTEIFADERFAFPPPKLAVYPTAPTRNVARAWDDLGADVTDIIRARDERYLDTFGRGAYQGLTRDHFVEVELPDDAPATGALWLVASGWIHPTDSSINVAIGQGTRTPPQPLSLEVPDGAGGWTVAKPGLGFPSGKSKTILIDLEGVFRAGTPRRLRLRTNMEIFWDSLHWATALPQTELRTQRLDAATADLRYRGFSVVRQADASSPELPDYDKIAGTVQRWRDLVGYHTRFGDVRELLQRVDDRYVMMNAGDEMLLRFAAPPAPPAGWVRDFILIGDGWEKDGDYNTLASKTVLPLPSHDNPNYSAAAGRLEDDPVFKRHPQDWQNFHTRYVTPQQFGDVLRAK